MRKIWKNNTFWEIIGYLTLTLCIVGQISVGYIYLVAQGCYLTANVLATIRNFALHLPTSNKVRDIVFTGITIGLIIIYIVR